MSLQTRPPTSTGPGSSYLWLTINPGGKNLIEIVSCGAPVVTNGSSGLELVKNMKAGFDLYGIISCQVESGVFDGVYFHCSVEEHFNDVYQLQAGDVLFSWDGLHLSGLIDTRMCKRPEFFWLKVITDICVRIFKLFNWGANFEKLNS